ncbi:hypothetical protein BDF22DRAFT_686117 [Syncephalis plumigaleata]|nr:hypothetical protein BDF22DRAFT_686117 [Syncephalis plumigaleata]
MSHWFTMLNVPLIRFTFTSPCSDMKTKLDEVNMISLAELRTRNRASMNELVRNKIVLVMDQQMGDDELLSMIQRMDIAGIVTDIRDHQQLSCGRPLFIISKSDGQLISGMYRKNPRQMLVFAGEHGNINENSPALVDSMDPTSPYGKPSVKPDILAPSQDLFTVTNTAFNHGYIQYSGIDAAVSYAAGAVALFIQAKERTNINVFTVKRALQNTASDVYYSLTRKGLQPVKYPYAGLLNVEQAHFMTR